MKVFLRCIFLNTFEGIFKCAACSLFVSVGNLKDKQVRIRWVRCKLTHSSFAAAPSLFPGSKGELRLPEPERWIIPLPDFGLCGCR